MRPSRSARHALALLGAALLVVLARPAPVLAHAVLLAAYPSDGSVLAVPPPSIHLWFSEPVQPAGPTITVLAPSGRSVTRGPIHDDGLEMSVAVDAVMTGTYVVLWQVISVDTHPSSGRFTFSVGRRSGTSGSAGAVATVAVVGLGLQVVARWLHFAGFALGFGPLAFGLLVLGPLGLPRGGAAEQRLWRLVTVGIVALLLAEPLALLAQTTSLGTGVLFDPSLAGAALASSFGRVLAQRVAAALLLWVLAGAAAQGSAAAARAGLVLGLALALVDGESSHAIGAGPLWVGLGINTVHVAAMGIWAGGLAALLATWPTWPPWPPSPPSGEGRPGGVRGEVVARFGRVAVVALAVLAASGAALAWLHLAGPANLVATAYGRALTAKTLVALDAMLLALVGTRVRRERRPRWWCLEGAALLGVLALAGLVVSLPPPA